MRPRSRPTLLDEVMLQVTLPSFASAILGGRAVVPVLFHSAPRCAALVACDDDEDGWLEMEGDASVEWDLGEGVDVTTFLSEVGGLDEYNASIEGEIDGIDDEVAAAAKQHELLTSRGLLGPLPVSGGDLDQVVRDEGVARAANVLSAPVAERLRKSILDEIERSIAEVAEGSATSAERFSSVLSSAAGEGAPTSRWDVRLSRSPEVDAALSELLHPGAPLGDAFAALGGGGGAELWELAAVATQPGAAAQCVHADTLYSEAPCLFTAFVALQPVTPPMGPTLFLPTTHTADAHTVRPARRSHDVS